MRRRLTALGAAALVAGLVLFVGVFATQERVTAKARIVTKTYTNPTPISIPALEEGTDGLASPYPSSIAVGLRRATIRDVNVILRNYSHTFPDDVDVLLVGPARAGKDALIMSDVGGGGDFTGVTLTLDDEAPSPLPDGKGWTNPDVSGSYQPSDYVEMKPDGAGGFVEKPDVFPDPSVQGSFVTFSGNVALSAFDGTAPRGTWRLYVVDDGAAGLDPGTGQFAGGWSLQIRARVVR